MNGFSLRTKLGWAGIDSTHRLFELSLSLLVGLLVGSLLVFSSGLASSWQGLIVVAIIAVPFVLLVRNLEKIVLAGIALGLPLNLDVSLVISPYARNLENLASGERTIVALTELRVSLILALVVIGYVYWLIRPRGPDRRPVRFFASTSLPALGLIFFNILSIFRAQDRQLSLFLVVQLVELFLMYFYLANHLETSRDYEFFMKVLMWGMLAESLLMIVQMLSGWTFLFAGLEATAMGNPRRVGGTLGTPNVAGGILPAYLVITCAMIGAFPKRSDRALAAASLGLGCIALIGTGTRSGWLSFAAALLGFVLISLWRGWMRRGTVVLVVSAVLVIGALFYQPILDRFTADDRGSAASRPKMFALAWNVIQANPWLGVGANNYALVAYNYYTPEVGNLGYVIDSSVHNRFLLTWSETGLGGLLCFVGFLIAPLVLTWRHIRSPDRSRAMIALGLGCALVSVSIGMLSEPFSLRSSLYFVWMLVALIASLRDIRAIQSAPAAAGQA
jgi:O-antigen ligase